jgi:hypothetical protein
MEVFYIFGELLKNIHEFRIKHLFFLLFEKL